MSLVNCLWFRLNLHVTSSNVEKKKRGLQKTVTLSQAHKKYTPVKRCYVTTFIMPGSWILSRKGPDSRHKLCLGIILWHSTKAHSWHSHCRYTSVLECWISPVIGPPLSLLFDTIKVPIVYHGSTATRHLLSYTHHVN